MSPARRTNMYRMVMFLVAPATVSEMASSGHAIKSSTVAEAIVSVPARERRVSEINC